MPEPVRFPVEGARGQVGPVARAFGFAGLLPQIAAVWLARSGQPAVFPHAGQSCAFFYGALILSFLGGMWWGFAMRRTSGQGRLVALAIMPSLVAFFVALGWMIHGGPTLREPLVMLGLAIILTLLVDYRLFRTGEAPQGWMALRVPLSLGLGGLTIAAGLA